MSHTQHAPPACLSVADGRLSATNACLFQAKVIFTAPTRPLVRQQAAAISEAVGFPKVWHGTVGSGKWQTTSDEPISYGRWP
jgi:hypothetical protein